MGKEKLTPWFDGSKVKPKRPGVYMQLSGGTGRRPGYQYWDGRQWFSWCETIDCAYRMRAYDPAAKSAQNDNWRGLAVRPNV